MAKGKGSGKSYTSKGERSNVSKGILREMRAAYLQSGMRLLNQQKALAKGKDIVMTIENPNKNQTNKPFICVKVAAKTYAKQVREAYLEDVE